MSALRIVAAVEVNAHLIAAAPDLLAAAKAVSDRFVDGLMNYHDERIEGALDAMRAAIAKAKGDGL